MTTTRKMKTNMLMTSLYPAKNSIAKGIGLILRFFGLKSYKNFKNVHNFRSVYCSVFYQNLLKGKILP